MASGIYGPFDYIYKGNPGDFTEFFFDGISSQELGITRVSGGDRYDLDLQPTIKNKTVEVPGGHGYYFFGSQYKDKVFKISIAFDNLSELQVRKIAQTFSPCNELKDFYFTNHPYKQWKVKITQPIVLNTICFDEGSKHRKYKGEGTIQLQAYTPFATERLKYLDEYVEEFKQNVKLRADEAEIYVSEWEEGSNLLWNTEDISPEEREEGITKKQFYPYDTVEAQGTGGFIPGFAHIWNAGDFDADYMLYFYLPETASSSTTFSFRIRCSDLPAGSTYGEFKIKDLVLVNNDAGFRVNSKLSLIEGVDEDGEPTGTIYNQYKSGGEYFKLPKNESWIILDDYYGEWFRSKTLNDEIEVYGYGPTLWGDISGNTWGTVDESYENWGDVLNDSTLKNYTTLLQDAKLIQVKDKDLLTDMQEDEFDFEYHDRYL